MALVELRDRGVIAEFCRRRPAVHAYELGDLDDFFWPHTRWLGWRTDGRLEQLALLYDEPDPPVLLALAEDRGHGMRDLLGEVAANLPSRVYAHLSPGLVEALAPRLVPETAPVAHRKLGLADPSPLRAHDTAAAAPLSGSDLAEVERFYADAYPGTWFQPRMLDTGRYVGIRRDGRLVCVAGVHVWSPTWRVAALGNVATLPALRGSGLATAACAHLCRVLLDDGIDVISLNVRADNAAALRAYEKLGFAHAADYVEVSLVRGRG
ncbi:MAG TPA: GNAT family N-acetyltransferase [Gaiella sp.]